MSEEPKKIKKPRKKMQLPRKATLSRRLRLGNPTGKRLETALKTLRTGVYPTMSSSEGESSEKV
jgi:hypothetical protein